MNTSALKRLLSLPAMFRGADLTLRFGWTTKNASQYLYLWKRAGLVQPFGGHSDVYANLVVQPKPDWDSAAVMAMPSAVLVGVEALRRHGWVTQIQQEPEIAVRATGSCFSTPLFVVTALPDRWFEAVKAGRDRSQGALPCLRPAWALADMLARQGWDGCGIQPDDIDWELAEARDEADWDTACGALGLELPALLDLAEDPRSHRPGRYG